MLAKRLLQFLISDLVAKVLYFIAFAYLAQVLGVEQYGVLEFALALFAYVLLFGDGGLELWAIRSVAKGKDVHEVFRQVVPLRLVLATGSFIVLLLCLPVLPDFDNLPLLIALFGLVLFVQAVSPKWALMGQEKIGSVGLGIAISQIIFAGSIFWVVQKPQHIVWIPILRLLGDSGMVAFYWQQFWHTAGRPSHRISFRNSVAILRTALVMGAAHGLALMSYNFDSLLLGFMTTAKDVGWYGAAYKPITSILAIPVTYFVGLFPTLSRTYETDRGVYNMLVKRSLWLSVIVAFPVAIGGIYFAKPIILLIFGADYLNSVLPLQILSCVAALVILRGTLRQGFQAAGLQQYDMRCAGTAVGLNCMLNLLMIPIWGIVGAAAATLASEIVWFTMAVYLFNHKVMPLTIADYLWRPIVAGVVMMGCMIWLQLSFWVFSGVVGGIVYLAVLLVIDGQCREVFWQLHEQIQTRIARLVWVQTQ